MTTLSPSKQRYVLDAVDVEAVNKIRWDFERSTCESVPYGIKKNVRNLSLYSIGLAHGCARFPQSAM